MLKLNPSYVLFSLLISISAIVVSSDSHVYETFLQCMNKQTKSANKIVFSQTNKGYTTVLRDYIRNARFNTSSSSKPLIIITPLVESDVQAAVICSKQVGYRLKARSGGHDYDGLSYISDKPFFMLDMFHLKDVSINMADQTAWVGAGALLGELYYKIWQNSKVHGFPAGVCPTVGAGGHISGGGYGNMLRKYGLSVDYVIDAKIVNVNGKLLDRKSMGEDLFWAINGGGGASFGVILSYRIKLVPVPEKVTVFRIEKTLEENALDMVYKWQFVAPKTDPGLFMRMLLQPVTRNKKKTLRASVVALYLGKADDVVGLMGKEFPELGLKKESCIEGSWIQSVVWWDDEKNDLSKPEQLLQRNLDSASFGKRKSDYVAKELTKENLKFVFQKMMEVGKTGLVFNPYGGKMKQVSNTATPFPHRQKLWKIQYSITWKDGSAASQADALAQTRKLYSYLTPFVSKNPRNTYLNYRDVDIGVNHHGKNSYEEGEVYGRKMFGENFDRLVKVKTAVDPGNYFQYEQSIPVKSISGSRLSSSISARPLTTRMLLGRPIIYASVHWIMHLY